MQVVRSYGDDELLSALKSKSGINDAIRTLYRDYYSLLENYILNNKGTKDDAADIIQETIVAFVESVQQEKFRGDASISSFLYSITRHLWLSELRKRSSADNRNKIFEKGRDSIDQLAMQQLIYREHYNAIQKLFEKLGDKCKQLLFLVYYEDLSMKEISEQMPEYQNEQVLRNKKYKCMKQLEQMIQDNEPLRTQFKNALKHAE